MRTLLSIILAALVSISACAADKIKMKSTSILVAYYSATGTTETVAKAIAEASNGTLYEITPAEIYTDKDLDWHNKQSRSSIEMRDQSSRPALGGKAINASEYDVILLGYPIWWNLCPRVVNTWIESQELDGKKVIPFATSGGSGIGYSVNALRRLYPQVKWVDGKLLNGGAKDAKTWVKSLFK